MSRAQRLLDLLQILRRHRLPVSGRQLADELGISLRTLYRDIATLQQQGAHIEGAAGVGYVLRPGFELPPLMFSLEEIEALVLGMRWVSRHGDQGLVSAARDVLAKVGSVLPANLRLELESNALLVGSRPSERVADGLLGQVRDSIRRQGKLQFAYRDAGGQFTERVVWPFGLGYFEQVRVVMAWCELRQDLRHFRLDRMEQVSSLAERYPRQRQALLKDWYARHDIPAQ
ncbi:YafY family protein [Pseudomonas sp. C9-3]|uniref:helix-turn-helix transcriptional regulator n=1 Tax=Pseudomonas sp. C9-3 TaxID=3078264 RepID=UPI0028E62FE1|nr:YafY family protein [Pseudomonas sp. C9-3]